MAACEWREDTDGFRYLVTDYRDATPQERYSVFHAGADAAGAAGGRVACLVIAGDGGLDPAWFKEVKDRNSSENEDHVRVALVGLGGRGAAVAAMLNARLSHERARAFGDEATALAWLKETA